MTTTYQYHPIADLFPLLSDESSDFKGMVTSIGKDGLFEAITLFEGKILDGRNRARACEKTGIEPRYEDYTGNDPFAFVAGKNLHRRHLTTAQLAFIAREMVILKNGRPENSSRATGLSKTVTKVARDLGIGTTSVRAAGRVKKAAIPEVVVAAKAGKIKLRAAETISKLPREEQLPALEATTSKKKARKSDQTPKTLKPITNGRLSLEQIAEYEAKINAPSTYPEDLPLPVHSKAHLTAHIQEAITDLKKHEPRIGQMSRRWCYQEVWCLTQRIQAYAPGYGHSADRVADMHPRWVDWARSVAGKVRAVEFLELDGPQKPKQDSPNDAPKKQRKFSEAGLEKRLKEWRRLVKHGLRDIPFAPDDEFRVLQATEQTILTYFEERRTRHVRLTPSPTGEPPQTANGSPPLNREQ